MKKISKIVKKILLYVFVVSIFYFIIDYFWSEYNAKKIYSLASCESVCKANGYKESKCAWISELESGMKNMGSCVVDRSTHCGSLGQCNCMCQVASDFKKYAIKVEPEIIYSKNLNFFYIHVSADSKVGHSWEVDYDPNYLELVDRIHALDQGDLHGSDVTFRFKTINRGKTKVYLYYRKLWEDEEPAEVEFYEIQISRFIKK